jgi:GntR family transcriptional regulator
VFVSTGEFSIDRFSEVPPWRQLAGELRRQIESGEIQPGRPIPSKAQLRGRYEVAGATIDKAVSLLKSEGLLRSSPGMGLYVVRR